MSAKQILGIAGPLSPECVTLVLPHEHIFTNTSSCFPQHEAPLTADDIAPEDLQLLRREPQALGGRNLHLIKDDEVFRELEALNVTTSTTEAKPLIVDTTDLQKHHMGAKVKRLADRANVVIVASTCIQQQWLSDVVVANQSIDNKAELLANRLVTDLQYGIKQNEELYHVCAIYQPVECLDANNDLIATALAKAHVKTGGVPIYLSFAAHRAANSCHHRETILSFLSIMMAHNVTGSKVVLCHADAWSESDQDRAFLLELATAYSITLSFNMIGLYTVSDVVMINPHDSPFSTTDTIGAEPPRDRTIAACIEQLLHQNPSLVRQIVLSPNVHQRIQYRRYGGGGYNYVLEHFQCRLRVTADQWRDMTLHNGVRLLTWYTEPDAAPVPKHFLYCSICHNAFEPIVGEYFSKFTYVYCGTKCLRKHSKQNYRPLTNE